MLARRKENVRMMTEKQAQRKKTKKFEAALAAQPFTEAADRYYLRQYVLEISITVCSVLEALAMSDSAKIRRPDLGIEVRGYYNYPSNIKCDIIRIDREPLFTRLEQIPGLQPEEAK